MCAASIKYYVVDAFSDRLFSGNPAGVCLLDKWLPDETMQQIAAENNLSETAFLLKNDGYYDLRWFTPEMEVDLCGHATLASAHVLSMYAEQSADILRFRTLSGELTVQMKDDILFMDLPSRPAEPISRLGILSNALGISEYELYKSADLLVVLESEVEVNFVNPDFAALMKVKEAANMPIDNFSVIITAPGSDHDFVSRVFAPNAGINEDPVTGSAHCVLIPYWSKRLGKNKLTARQLSKRGGMLWCEDAGDRVIIGGKATLYLSGYIYP